MSPLSPFSSICLDESGRTHIFVQKQSEEQKKHEDEKFELATQIINLEYEMACRLQEKEDCMEAVAAAFSAPKNSNEACASSGELCEKEAELSEEMVSLTFNELINFFQNVPKKTLDQYL